MIVPAVPCREDCPADHIHLPPRRNVAPGSPDWWFAADAPRCAAGECASKEWVISRRNLAARLDFGDFASMFCYHCHHPLCVECHVGPTATAGVACEACQRDWCEDIALDDTEQGVWWRSRWMLALDTETTGKDPHTAELVSVAIVEYRNHPVHGEEIIKSEWLIDPGVPVPEDAARIHGITTDTVRRHGRPIGDALTEIADLLAAKWTPETPVCGFNVPYDLTVLDNALRRHLASPLAVSGPVVDPQCIDFGVNLLRHRRPGGQPSRRGLAELYREYCDSFPPLPGGYHDAAQDALAAARLVYAVGRSHETGAVPLGELQDLQRQWKGRHEAKFRRPRGLVEQAWPLEHSRRESDAPIAVKALGGGQPLSVLVDQGVVSLESAFESGDDDRPDTEVLGDCGQGELGQLREEDDGGDD